MPCLIQNPNLTVMHDVFLFNMGKYNALQFISIEFYLITPDLQNTEYYEQFVSSEYYAPSYVQMEVIDTLPKVC
jgi:hypothetical protein